MPPFVYRMPVRFSDVDHAGIVYYPVFLHYFHVTFEELFRARMGGRSYVSLLDDERVGFPSVSARCDFKSPLRFGDEAEIEMSVARLGERSVTFRYRVFRAADADRPERELAAEGENTCAVVDLNVFRAVPVPDQIRTLLADLVGE
jgi:YbgC/YbaW family acyl-CoA thioester hydrolase